MNEKKNAFSNPTIAAKQRLGRRSLSRQRMRGDQSECNSDASSVAKSYYSRTSRRSASVIQTHEDAELFENMSISTSVKLPGRKRDAPGSVYGDNVSEAGSQILDVVEGAMNLIRSLSPTSAGSINTSSKIGSYTPGLPASLKVKQDLDLRNNDNSFHVLASLLVEFFQQRVQRRKLTLLPEDRRTIERLLPESARIPFIEAVRYRLALTPAAPRTPLQFLTLQCQELGFDLYEDDNPILAACKMTNEPVSLAVLKVLESEDSSCSSSIEEEGESSDGTHSKADFVILNSTSTHGAGTDDENDDEEDNDGNQDDTAGQDNNEASDDEDSCSDVSQESRANNINPPKQHIGIKRSTKPSTQYSRKDSEKESVDDQGKQQILTRDNNPYSNTVPNVDDLPTNQEVNDIDRVEVNSPTLKDQIESAKTIYSIEDSISPDLASLLLKYRSLNVEGVEAAERAEGANVDTVETSDLRSKLNNPALLAADVDDDGTPVSVGNQWEGNGQSEVNANSSDQDMTHLPLANSETRTDLETELSPLRNDATTTIEDSATISSATSEKGEINIEPTKKCASPQDVPEKGLIKKSPTDRTSTQIEEDSTTTRIKSNFSSQSPLPSHHRRTNSKHGDAVEKSHNSIFTSQSTVEWFSSLFSSSISIDPPGSATMDKAHRKHSHPENVGKRYITHATATPELKFVHTTNPFDMFPEHFHHDSQNNRKQSYSPIDFVHRQTNPALTAGRHVVESEMTKLSHNNDDHSTSKYTFNDSMQQNLMVGRLDNLAQRQIWIELREATALMERSRNEETAKFWRDHVQDLQSRLQALRGGESGIASSSIPNPSIVPCQKEEEILERNRRLISEFTQRERSFAPTLSASASMDSPVASIEVPRIKIPTLPNPTPLDNSPQGLQPDYDLPMVDVIAPADLPGGYHFEAEIEGQRFLATVPAGGVRQGEAFTCYMRELESATIEVPVGYWKDDLVHICRYGCCHCMVINTIFCPLITLAQIQFRTKLDFLGRPKFGVDGLTNRTMMVSIILFWSATNFLLFAACNLKWSRGLELTIADISAFALINFAMLGFVIFVTQSTRNSIREKYMIREERCLDLEDLCCATWCLPCTVCQMARHTANYDEYEAVCCSKTGLPDGVRVNDLNTKDTDFYLV